VRDILIASKRRRNCNERSALGNWGAVKAASGGASVTARIVRIGLAVAALGLCWASLKEAAYAQTAAEAAPAASALLAVPPPKLETGFVSPYEIMRTVRSAGFHPVSRPLREGASYVLRATDFRGIPTRVVLDARTGVIRDATRIVPALAPAPPSAPQQHTQ
jgi:hypothetical protein